MQVPRIKKIVAEHGRRRGGRDKKILDNAVGDLTKITGQKPSSRKARKSIASFKIRED